MKLSGYFKASLKHRGSVVNTRIYLIDDLIRPLLGRSVLEDLKVIKFLANVESGHSGQDWMKLYPDAFQGLGEMPGEYTIALQPNAVPFSISVPRRVPLPLLPKVKAELERMVKDGIIEEVVEPTPWTAPLVVVPKANSEKIRITTYFTMLNKYILREKFEMPGVDYILAQIGTSKIFSRLDFNHGFFQLKLSESSKKLTAFMTPFGRFYYNRLPQGCSSSPEVFSKKIAQILSGLDGVIAMVDDICIHSPDRKTHHERLHKVLQRLIENHVTLNFEKCLFEVDSLSFLGYVIDSEGIRPDPKKVEAIANFKPPVNVSEVRQFLGLYNQVSKFIPKVSHETTPIRTLLQKDRDFIWGHEQQSCFEKLKQLLMSSEVLCHYDPGRETRIDTDASSYGLGTVCFQKHEEYWRPVAYVSRSLTNTETR